MKIFLSVFLMLTLIGPAWILISGKIDWSLDYRTANRESAHIAPDPKKNPDAIVQVYSARAFNWRGVIATHIWIATKQKNASQYMTYQVIGWRKLRGLPPLIIQADIPDRYWFGQKPSLILDVSGVEAEKLIPQIIDAAKMYPYKDDYEIWPGPNSNTFPAFVARHVPMLELALPSTAIGKDLLPDYKFFARAPSGTGYQISLFGILGLLLAKKEGIEINILSLVYGVQFAPFAIKLPGANFPQDFFS